MPSFSRLMSYAYLGQRAMRAISKATAGTAQQQRRKVRRDDDTGAAEEDGRTLFEFAGPENYELFGPLRLPTGMFPKNGETQVWNDDVSDIHVHVLPNLNDKKGAEQISAILSQIIPGSKIILRTGTTLVVDTIDGTSVHTFDGQVYTPSELSGAGVILKVICDADLGAEHKDIKGRVTLRQGKDDPGSYCCPQCSATREPYRSSEGKGLCMGCGHAEPLDKFFSTVEG